MLTKTETRETDEITWRDDLYPRFEPSPSVIQKYAENLDLLPPIEINQNNELIDGYHRWIAHKKESREIINVVVTQTESDRDFARLAMRRNAKHGLHLSNKEKRDWLLTWYIGLDSEEKQQLADDMGVSLRTVERWTSRKDKDLKEKRKRDVFDLWLACHTFEEIVEKIQKEKDGTIHEWIGAEVSSDFAKWHKLKIFPNHALDPKWKPPLYDVWKTQNKSNETSHPGNSEAQWVDNLLYMYTEPFDIVVDPFAGGGSTIDVCKMRLRRYWASDRLPIVERLDIRKWDVLQGPPPLHKRWGDVKLLYLDPPYWKQSEGKYSEDEQDLANMELERFYGVLTDFMIACAEKMHSGACIALIIQPTQWKAPEKKVVDHIVDVILRTQNNSLQYERRIQCPYESQQCNAQMVNWAKENRDVLVLSREIIIWRVT